ncbi:hypothetical protein GCM10020295_37180 [Streptomyces cinereospinus]
MVLGGAVAELVHPQVKDAGQVGEGGVAAGVGGEAVEGGDLVRVDVFVAFAGAVEVGKQSVRT